MTGEEITKVMEVRKRVIGSMAVDHIVMVNTVHREQDIGMSDCRVVSRTIAGPKQDMGVDGFTRHYKGGKSIVVGIFSINMDNMVEKDGNIGTSKSKAGDGKTLEGCNVDFDSNKKMGSMVRLGMVNMLDCKEQIVQCLEKNQVTELLEQGIRKHESTKELRIEVVRVQEVQDAAQLRESELQCVVIERIAVLNIQAVNDVTFSRKSSQVRGCNGPEFSVTNMEKE